MGLKKWGIEEGRGLEKWVGAKKTGKVEELGVLRGGGLEKTLKKFSFSFELLYSCKNRFFKLNYSQV